MLKSPNVVNPNGVLCNWHDTNHQAMCQVYQEFAYQTTYVTADFTMDSRPVNPTLPIIQQVQIVAKLVPISQISDNGAPRCHAADDSIRPEL